METHPRSPIALGSSGKPPGTGRLPARSTEHQTTELFEREVERALERDRGVQEERAESLRSRRREDRHAGFGAEPGGGREPRAETGPSTPPEESAQAQAAPPTAPLRSAGGNEATVGESGQGAGDPAPSPSRQETASHPPEQPLSEQAPELSAGFPARSVGRASGVPAGEAGALQRGDASAPQASRLSTAVSAEPRGPSARPVRPGTAPAPPPASALEEAEAAAAILRQIRAKFAPGMRRASFELEPAELGRLSIQVALRRGRVSAIVRAEREATLGAIERHAPELLAMLSDQGIEAERLELHLGFAGGGARRSARGGGHADRHPRVVKAATGPESVRAAGTPETRSAGAAGGIDTYA